MVLDDGEKTTNAMPISTHPCLRELRLIFQDLSDGTYCTGEKHVGSHYHMPLLDLPSTAMKVPAKKKKEDKMPPACVHAAI